MIISVAELCIGMLNHILQFYLMIISESPFVSFISMGIKASLVFMILKRRKPELKLSHWMRFINIQHSLKLL